jgi:hypothetical protein
MARHVSLLELAWRSRDVGESQTPVDYLDFIVDGVSLSDTFGEPVTGLIGCFMWSADSAYQQEQVRQLLLERPSELETGRLMLYVCPECGHIGCGAITFVAEQQGNLVVWRQFGHEVNYRYDDDDSLFDLSEYAGVGPFYFDSTQYREALTNWPARA